MPGAKDQTIYFTRHGEGYHQGEPQEECERIKDAGNSHVHIFSPILPANHDIELNEKGIAQCQNLCKNFPYHDKIDLIVASPLRRAIQTALIGYEPEIKKGMKVLLMPDLQEVSDMPMDIGSSQEDLEKQFGDKLDYSRLYDGWQVKADKHATDTDSLLERGGRMRQYLKDRKEKNIVAVFHGSFVHYVTGNLEDGEKVGKSCGDHTCSIVREC